MTVTGRAELVKPEDDFACGEELLTGRHAYLSKFVQSASCGLFRIENSLYAAT